MFDNAEIQLAAEMGVSNYGQMTAGGWMYIGPQGIVHGTYPLLNAGRLSVGIPPGEDLSGVVYLSSGLGDIGRMPRPRPSRSPEASGSLPKWTVRA